MSKRIKHVMESDLAVAHLWVAQDPEQEWARHSNVNYSGRTIYSYRWWPMAIIQEDGVILMRNWNYSSFTAKHMRYVKSAVKNHEVIYCADPSSFNESLREGIRALKTSKWELEKARKKTPHIRNNEGQYQELLKYLTYFKVGMPQEAEDFRVMNLPGINDIISKEAEKEAIYAKLVKEAEEECKRRNKELDDAERVTQGNLTAEQEWIQGGSGSNKTATGDRWQVRGKKLSMYTPWGNRFSRHDFTMTRLRIIGDKIQTSQDAYVSVTDGKRIWELMKRKAKLLGERCGNFAIVGWNGELVIGCHHITREELKRFVLCYGWDTEEVVFEALGL